MSEAELAIKISSPTPLAPAEISELQTTRKSSAYLGILLVTVGGLRLGVQRGRDRLIFLASRARGGISRCAWRRAFYSSFLCGVAVSDTISP